MSQVYSRSTGILLRTSILIASCASLIEILSTLEAVELKKLRIPTKVVTYVKIQAHQKGHQRLKNPDLEAKARNLSIHAQALRRRAQDMAKKKGGIGEPTVAESLAS